MIAAQPAGLALTSLYERELAAALAVLEHSDNEALHDFRVALRRLHVLLKQLAQQDKPCRKAMRRIKALITQSNTGRDAQVMLAWLSGEWPRLNEREQVGARRWQRRLERIQGQYIFDRQQLASVLKGLVPILDKLLPLDGKVQLPLGMLAAQRLEQQTSELSSLMKGNGEEQLHLIRLKAKTVRYL